METECSNFVSLNFPFCFLLVFLGSKVCYDEATNLTKKVREALKDDGEATSNQTKNDSSEQQSSNTKDTDSESVKKRDKV